MFRRAVKSLAARESRVAPLHHPVTVTIAPGPEDGATVVEVVSRDEPGFLHLFSNLLSMRQVFIHKVAAETKAGRIRDRFYVTDRRGGPLTAENDRRALQLAVVLAVKFTGSSRRCRTR